MIENYISKSIDCECGRPHQSNVETVEIKKGVIDTELAQYIKRGNYRKLTVVCDKKTYKVAGKRVCEALDGANIPYHLHTFVEDSVLPNEHFIGNLAMGMALDSDLILAAGSGTINDICRYVSAVAGKPYCVVGTAPSMDGYVSASSALIYNNFKLTFETHAPRAVFLDPEILAAAPRDMIAAGVGDLLGKINCLADWRLSKIINNEWHCEFISNIVESAVNKVTENAKGIAEKNQDAISDLVEGLLLSGVAMDFAGNSRPASGCEHHISHFLEMRYLLEGREAVFHGTKVGIGTVITLKAYEYIATLNPDFSKVKTLSRPSLAEWKENIRKAFMGAADEIILLEEKSQKNGAERLSLRLASIEANWERIKALAAGTTKSAVVYEMLKSLNAPTKPHEIGVDREMARQAIMYAKEIRDRYTVLQLLYDLGELENFTNIVINEYYS